MRRKDFEKLALSRWRRLTAGEWDHEHAAWSPEGRWIAFAAGPPDARRICICDRRGRFAYAVAPAETRASRPRWSPEGRRLAFDARPTDGPPLVLVQDLPEGGDEPRSLVRGTEGAAIHAAFSPDGRTIAYASDDGSPGLFRIWILDLETGDRRRLTNDPERNDAHPTFSPDGTLIAFHGYHGERATRSSLFLLSIANGALLRLTEGAGFDKHPCFAGPGIVLYHREALDGTQELRAVDVLDGHDRALTGDDVDAKQPAARPRRKGGLRVAWSARPRTGSDARRSYTLRTATLEVPQ